TTSRTDGAVRHGNTVRGAQTTNVPALHTTGKTPTNGRSGHIDELAFSEVVSLKSGANLDQVLCIDAEFGHVPLGFDLGGGEVAALCLGRVLRLGLASAKLQGDVP